MMRERHERVPFPAEFFHELARQFDRIPFDAVGPRHAELLDAREQMVQPMAEFVKEGDHFVVREKRGPLFAVDFADRRREITIEIGDWCLDATGYALARDCIVHPRAAALRRPRVQVEIKLADQVARAIAYAEKAHVGMPFGRLGGLDSETV